MEKDKLPYITNRPKNYTALTPMKLSPFELDTTVGEPTPHRLGTPEELPEFPKEPKGFLSTICCGVFSYFKHEIQSGEYQL
jgi:hypothetical protein